MTCQRCQDEASVHLSEIVDGRKRELHLCVPCARQAGLTAAEPPGLGMLELVVQKLIVAHVGELVGELARRKCPSCGGRFMDVKTSGRLGCPDDYEVFAPGLSPLLRRAHDATRHVGKVPRRRDPKASERLRLRSRLRDAVAREAFEEAAAVRDVLRLCHDEPPRTTSNEP
jgi:protein arginine kinase activator